MKRYKQNAILFFLAMSFLLLGLWGSCFSEIRATGIRYAKSILQGHPASFDKFQQQIDKTSTKNLSYHDNLLDIHSGKEALLGTRAMKKDDSTVIKTNSGALASLRIAVPEDHWSLITDNIKKLMSFSEEKGAKFLYVSIPGKEHYLSFPINYPTCAPENYDTLIQILQEQDIPHYDFADTIHELGLNGESLYFHTDHHWKPRPAFLAYQMLCRELAQRYGFAYDETYLDLQNYEITTYPQHFLGSLGRKTGRFFSQYHADDFDLVVPKFETEFITESPYEELSRQGPFQESLLFMEFMEKDYYRKLSYNTYLGGNYLLQIIRNLNNPTGKKFVVVKDSYANVVIPYLATQASEIHIVDIRKDVKGWTGKFSIMEYIDQISPDYVLVIYNTPLASDWKGGKYLFQ